MLHIRSVWEVEFHEIFELDDFWHLSSLYDILTIKKMLLRSVVVITEHILKTTKWKTLQLANTLAHSWPPKKTWSLNNTLKRTGGV
jgi:hypothetical protein